MEPGARVGRYVIESLLGRGGMGQVYRAYDEVLHHSVALKLLHAEPGAEPGGPTPDGGAPSTKGRILREARMAAALEHANVVAIHDVGEHEGMPFIVMELVPGRPLRAFVGAQVPPADRVRWLVDVARALAAAHKKGLVHRDVKPENVIVRDDGVVKVLDFGIARLTQGRLVAGVDGGVAVLSPLGTTQDGSTMAGTPAYMSSEQIRGEQVDARADQFAWGVMAYELLSGRLPWPGDSPLLRGPDSRLSLDPAALGVSGAIAEAVLRAMASSRDARFGSMDDVVVALGAGGSLVPPPVASSPAVGSSPEFASAPTERATASASSVSASRGRSRQAPRRRAAIAALGGLAVLGALVWAVARRPHPPRAPAASAPASPASVGPALRFHPVELRRLTFDPGCEEFPTLTPDGRTVVFDATVGDDDHLVAMDVATGARRILTHEAGWQFAPVLSPDGTRIAYLAHSPERTVTNVIPLDGSSPPVLVRAGHARPTWTPDGTAIWAGSARALERVDLATNTTTRRLLELPSATLILARELPDGRIVALLMNPDHTGCLGLGLYPAGADTPSVIPLKIDEALAITSDGAHALVSKQLPNDHFELWQVPLTGGEPSFSGYNAVQPTKGLAIAGDRIVWSTCRSEQAISVLKESPGARALAMEPLFPSADWQDSYPIGVPGSETRLLVLSDRSGRPQPWLIDLSSAEPPRPLETGDVVPSESAISPDGRFLAFAVADHGIHVIPLDGSTPARVVTEDPADREPTFGRDNHTVYFTTRGASGRRAIGRTSIDDPSSRVIILERAKRAFASPTSDRLVYVTDDADAEDGLPRILDLRTKTSAPVSSQVPSGVHSILRWSPDGRRIAVTAGARDLVEVDAARGTILHTFTTGDEIGGMTYLGSRLVIARNTWTGDVWTARNAPEP